MEHVGREGSGISLTATASKNHGSRETESVVLGMKAQGPPANDVRYEWRIENLCRTETPTLDFTVLQLALQDKEWH